MTTKRMSAEEKRKVLLDIYHKTKSVYTEKEILTLASKAGINANTVADVNTSCIDDGLVEKEKIGGSNYFWSFPAKKDRMMQLEYEKCLEQIEQLKHNVTEANSKLLDAKRGREDDDDEEDNEEGKNEEEKDGTKDDETKDDETKPSPKKKKAKTTMNRATKLQRLNEIVKERTTIESELSVLKENDPQAIADLQKELDFVTQSANRWTDNIFNCKSYLTKKRGMDKKEANKILGITDAFDYPEDKIPK